MFKYDWSKIDVKTGLIFMIGVLVVFYVMGNTVVAVAVGTSALLAWCTLLLVPPQSRRRDFVGLAVYLLAGAALTWLSYVAAPNTAGFLIAMFLVTFVAYMMLLVGAHEFMSGWCLAYWFMVVPLLTAGGGFKAVLYAHLSGTAVVIAVNVLKPLWAGRSEVATAEAQPSEPPAPEPSVGYMVSYATIVASSIAGGVALGSRFLAVDPTAIANGTLNIISPSFKLVWRSAVERVVLVTLGIIAGFYLGWFFPGDMFGKVLTAVMAFATMSTVMVSFGVLMGFLMVMTAYPWGVMHSEAGHLIANEKLLGDFVGVVIALIAIALLVRLQKAKPA